MWFNGSHYGINYRPVQSAEYLYAFTYYMFIIYYRLYVFVRECVCICVWVCFRGLYI